jgi:hypothetical protein
MSGEKLVSEIKDLKSTLDQLEGRLAATQVPLTVLKDFKSTVDHTRLMLWALLSAESEKQEGPSGKIIARFRVLRAKEICEQISQDISTQEITSALPELPQFHSALKTTLDHINRLYGARR